MSDRKLYQQKLQAQLDEWHAELDKLKAQAKGASADAQHGMQEQIDALEAQMAEARDQLKEFGAAGDEAWASLKAGLNASWESLKLGFKEAGAKFRKH